MSAEFSAATLVRRLHEGFTLYVGDKDADTSQRFYVKTTDGGRTLPPEECRARMEVTLAGAALPFASLQDAADFRFETLSCWFRFRKLHTDAATWTPVKRAVASRQVVIGTREKRGRRLYSANTQADTKLNERVRNALRDLTRRMTKVDTARVQKSGGRTVAAPL